MNVLVPVIAVVMTLLTGSIIFSIMGFNPLFALHTFFISPISSAYGFSELLVKATPLALIAIGLAFCFKNNLYNIGAEGQLTMGAIFGGSLRPFASPCVNITAPINLVLTPQLVAQTYSSLFSRF